MKHIILFFLLFISTDFLACCSGSEKSIYPLGTSQENLVVAEVNLLRRCKKERGDTIAYTMIRGVVDIGYWDEEGDSIIKIENIDTIWFSICKGGMGTLHCDEAINNYFNNLLPLYEKALVKAKGLKSFIEAKLINYTFVNDSSYKEYAIIDDTLIKIGHKILNPNPDNYSYTRGYLNSIRDIRSYKVGKRIITVLNISEKSSPFGKVSKEDKYIVKNKNQFKSLSSGLTFVRMLWHGENRNYVFISEK